MMSSRAYPCTVAATPQVAAVVLPGFDRCCLPMADITDRRQGRQPHSSPKDARGHHHRLSDRKRGITIRETDHTTSAIDTARHVRQHMSRGAMRTWRIGSQQSGFISWRQKKTGAPTPDFLVFRMNWSSPKLDQIVAKR